MHYDERLVVDDLIASYWKTRMHCEVSVMKLERPHANSGILGK